MSRFPSSRLPALQDAAARIEQGGRIALGGLWGASGIAAAAALIPHHTRWAVHITAAPGTISLTRSDWDYFSRDDTIEFPAFPLITVDSESTENVYLRAERLSILVDLMDPESTGNIVLPFQALFTPVPSRDTLRDAAIVLKAGAERSPAQLGTALVNAGFTREDVVDVPGSYAIRGGVVDIFPLHGQDPIRLDYFGDTIETLRRFDPETQRTTEEVERFTLFSEPQDERMFTETLLDHLPDDAVIWTDTPEEIQSRIEMLSEEHEIPEMITDFRRIWKTISAHAGGSLSSLPIPERENHFSFRTQSVQRFHGTLSGVRQDLEAVLKQDVEIEIACPAEGDVQRMAEILTELEMTDLPIRSVPGDLSQGFVWPDAGLACINYLTLFNRIRKKKASVRKRTSRDIESFLDLKPGDYVVHVGHGIGKFIGTDMIEKDGRKEESFAVEFADRVRLHVPASRVDVLQKYIGVAGRAPRLSKLGGKEWINRTARAAKSVEELAKEMLQIQALREQELGIAFPEDGEWQLEFEASFPYQETDDQLLATDQIKADMENSRPMDRLICGDVGYGKTELAMRAAFKAATAGRQVGVLVPTTLLAQQHYQTFCERMASYPVRIEVLSRFRTKKQQREVLEKMATGDVDIVIGTHRLVQDDVHFKQLGLVIIDEEQRFGVEHKEKLKGLRATTDVLTLSATPIPRTLHMSLLGIKDISTLMTAPRDRLSIETRVMLYDEELIRRAILRELNRDGQVFFVHNRVHSIQDVAHRLGNIVPEASFVVGHGQMKEDDLEETMFAFMNQEADVLISTTIIESGLDIPSANTMIIHDADQFGLADLHQLRGRIGRYRNQAYCYCLIPRHRPINTEAKQRLKAIEEFSDLGSGFKIAMRDLEIRGVGNLLGREQHGHISAIGYEMYCKLLESAVHKFKNDELPEQFDPQLDLPIEAYIPDDYIPALTLRIDAYRRFARVREVEDLNVHLEELRDRYGALPRPVESLRAIAEIRIWACAARVTNLLQGEHGLMIHTVSPVDLAQLKKKWDDSLRVLDDTTGVFPYGHPWPEELMAAARHAAAQG
jgi:transcription-repair coupling factor (superfamily II helicase)